MNKLNYRSVTDFRFKTSKVFSEAKMNPVVILSRSKPMGVLISFNNYETIMSDLEDYYASKKAMQLEKKTRKRGEYVSLENFEKVLNV